MYRLTLIVITVSEFFPIWMDFIHRWMVFACEVYVITKAKRNNSNMQRTLSFLNECKMQKHRASDVDVDIINISLNVIELIFGLCLIFAASFAHFAHHRFHLERCGVLWMKSIYASIRLGLLLLWLSTYAMLKMHEIKQRKWEFIMHSSP